MEHFEKLNKINVNEHTEKKNGLTYLTWSWAWAEVKKIYPTATYEIIKFDNLPYTFDEKTGYMVFTKVTIEGITHEMWLPVMDGANKAMLDHKYTYEVKDYKTGGMKEKEVEAATMFDINKTIMRCLVKNLAMFGLGLYIYSGEDLPEEPIEYATEKQIETIKKLVPEENMETLFEYYKIKSLEEITKKDATALIKNKSGK